MLLGKLATPATKVIQNGLNVESVSAEYMIVNAKDYVIGGTYVNFEVKFGNIITESEKERFDIVLRHNVGMTTEELSTWGTDDSILLDLIAVKLGITITEKVLKDLHYTY